MCTKGRNLVAVALASPHKGKPRMNTISVLRRFGFDAPLLRSGVVAVDSNAPPNSALLFVHGAPSVIQQLVSKTTLPPDCRQVILQFMVFALLLD